MTKKTNEIKNLSVVDLEKTLSDKKEALRVFRFGVSGSKIKNMKEGRKIRKDIARVLTEINFRGKVQSKK